MWFRHLVTYMNGKADADTLTDPAVFFSLLCTFAAGLDAAHADNVAADKARLLRTLLGWHPPMRLASPYATSIPV